MPVERRSSLTLSGLTKLHGRPRLPPDGYVSVNVRVLGIETPMNVGTTRSIDFRDVTVPAQVFQEPPLQHPSSLTRSAWSALHRPYQRPYYANTFCVQFSLQGCEFEGTSYPRQNARSGRSGARHRWTAALRRTITTVSRSKPHGGAAASAWRLSSRVRSKKRKAAEFIRPLLTSPFICPEEHSPLSIRSATVILLRQPIAPILPDGEGMKVHGASYVWCTSRSISS